MLSFNVIVVPLGYGLPEPYIDVDFSDFVVSDSEGVLTVSSSYVNYSSAFPANQSWLYMDYGLDFFTIGDVIRFEFEMSDDGAFDLNNDYGEFLVLRLDHNVSDGNVFLTEGQTLWVGANGAWGGGGDDSFAFQIGISDSGGESHADSSDSLSMDTTYYCEFVWLVDDSVLLDIYSDSGYSVWVDNCTYSSVLSEAYGFRYLSVGCLNATDGGSPDHSSSGRVGNMRLYGVEGYWFRNGDAEQQMSYWFYDEGKAYNTAVYQANGSYGFVLEGSDAWMAQFVGALPSDYLFSVAMRIMAEDPTGCVVKFLYHYSDGMESYDLLDLVTTFPDWTEGGVGGWGDFYSLRYEECNVVDGKIITFVAVEVWWTEGEKKVYIDDIVLNFIPVTYPSPPDFTGYYWNITEVDYVYSSNNVSFSAQQGYNLTCNFFMLGGDQEINSSLTGNYSVVFELGYDIDLTSYTGGNFSFTIANRSYVRDFAEDIRVIFDVDQVEDQWFRVDIVAWWLLDEPNPTPSGDPDDPDGYVTTFYQEAYDLGMLIGIIAVPALLFAMVGASSGMAFEGLMFGGVLGVGVGWIVGLVGVMVLFILVLFTVFMLGVRLKS